MTLSGPAFEPSVNRLYHSIYDKQGAHYNIFRVASDGGMEALRLMFPGGLANEMNFCLFSTSGIHGSYCTIEGCQRRDEVSHVTFLIIQPRLCCLRYGNCIPETDEDFVFLKTLRQSSMDNILAIGVEGT